MSPDVSQVVRVLERALADAVAGGMVGCKVILTDEDGSEWWYVHQATETAQQAVGGVQ